MANKLIRLGYTQIIPAKPGRPPTPARTVTTTEPVTAAIPSTSGGAGGGSAGSWVYVAGSGGVGSIEYGGGKYIWVPA